MRPASEGQQSVLFCESTPTENLNWEDSNELKHRFVIYHPWINLLMTNENGPKIKTTINPTLGIANVLMTHIPIFSFDCCEFQSPAAWAICTSLDPIHLANSNVWKSLNIMTKRKYYPLSKLQLVNRNTALTPPHKVPAGEWVIDPNMIQGEWRIGTEKHEQL